MSDDIQSKYGNSANFVTKIVCAYVSSNQVARSDLPLLIRSIHDALSHLIDAGMAPGRPESSSRVPTATQIRQSVTPDVLVSFIDGQGYKTLKRHLTKHGFDPISYRMHFGLPADYPMVSASYSKTRSDLAKSLGLGQSGPLDAHTGNSRSRKAAGAKRLN